MKIKINGFIHQATRSSYDAADAPPVFAFFSFDASDSKMGYMVVCPYEIETDLPEGWNVTAAEIATIEQQKKKALDDYNATVRVLNKRLGKLQAITNEKAA